ncbi:hypothetical protein HELRODRAFT_134634, partial [Helobdella robusta]|uniref:ZZ-type domain-containing protein n=1 Tax=Helobdella robusta TaxID=6412 RepID=T1EI57_HELRO
QLENLLRICLQIPKLLGECDSFPDENLQITVDSCLEKAHFNTNGLSSSSTNEISLSNFMDWMSFEPQPLVWICVLHRLSTAELSIHYVRCNVCRITPITGLRYRCLKCFNFDLCQTCFFHGLKARGHKLSHPMQEYWTNSTSSESMRGFTTIFRNKFRSKSYFKKHARLGYLPV